ncbi:MAG: HAMP domain-containing histidine kinase [Deltaproteobacteria bacterium]|nr:HAMP domain-containing histidine kinase [Deltaproteobacteria bacterium]
MKKLKILILVFCVTLSVPLGYFVLRTYRSLEQEEISELRYFAVTLFDQIEEELASLVLKEEGRPVDQYRYYYAPSQGISARQNLVPSPLSQPPKRPYILGYLQNDPDGSFHTPLVKNDKAIPPDRTELVAQLNEVNRIFNQKRTRATEKAEAKTDEVLAKREKEQISTFADKYLDLSRSKNSSRAYLGQEKSRVEEITPGQAVNLASKSQRRTPTKRRQPLEIQSEQEESKGPPSEVAGMAGEPREDQESVSEGRYAGSPGRPSAPAVSLDSQKLQVEVAPLQAIFINDRQIFIFRRIAINNQIFRQGFVLLIDEFLTHLADEYFSDQPMAAFANLRLSVIDRGEETTSHQSGATVQRPNFSLERMFPRPFSFLRASLTCARIPESVGRSTLNIMMVVLAVIILMGLFAIYQSARQVMALSDRRSRFVSSVTHELKTPLTNIRMYIEMLEQGIARDPEREQEYLRILGSESSRLSRLINNVLEFSKFEKKQTRLNLQAGTLKEVVQEVKEVMQEKLRQEGFNLKVEMEELPPFHYDREAMILILINVIDNSMKFGKSLSRREITIRTWPEPDRVKISVSDTGPGIPRHDLTKIFDDFYRVDNDLTRTTGGTGIGLALVKKLVNLMGGSVRAENNDGPGCAITISLPAKIA